MDLSHLPYDELLERGRKAMGLARSQRERIEGNTKILTEVSYAKSHYDKVKRHRVRAKVFCKKALVPVLTTAVSLAVMLVFPGVPIPINGVIGTAVLGAVLSAKAGLEFLKGRPGRVASAKAQVQEAEKRQRQVLEEQPMDRWTSLLDDRALAQQAKSLDETLNSGLPTEDAVAELRAGAEQNVASYIASATEAANCALALATHPDAPQQRLQGRREAVTDRMELQLLAGDQGPTSATLARMEELSLDTWRAASQDHNPISWGLAVPQSLDAEVLTQRASSRGLASPGLDL